MKLIVLTVIAAFVFAGCRGNVVEGNMTSSNMEDSLYYPIDSIPVDSEMIHQCISEDGKMKFICWNTGLGGTCPDYAVICLFKTDNGKVQTIRLHEQESEVAWVSNVHSIKKDDGTTFYIANRSHKASSNEGYEWLDGYKIDGDSLKTVSVFDGGDDLDECGMEITYSISYWYYATNGEGYDWLFEYDTSTRNLYVPEVQSEANGLVITDRYRVYHFDGSTFSLKGSQAHKGLHKSLCEYRNLVSYFKTKNFIVRIDKLDNGEYRYASWKVPSTMSDKPELVIGNGVYDSEADTYTFTNEGFVYICNHIEADPTEDAGIFDYHKFLIVKKGNRTLLKEEIIIP